MEKLNNTLQSQLKDYFQKEMKKQSEKIESDMYAQKTKERLNQLKSKSTDVKTKGEKLKSLLA